MKNVLILFIFLICMIGIGYDLKYGTLEHTSVKMPSQMASSTTHKDVDANKQNKMKYVQLKVKAGQTVLSIVEGLHKGNTPVSITEIVKDFESLNKDVDAQTIQTGKTYLFPIY